MPIPINAFANSSVSSSNCLYVFRIPCSGYTYASTSGNNFACSLTISPTVFCNSTNILPPFLFSLSYNSELLSIREYSVIYPNIWYFLSLKQHDLDDLYKQDASGLT